MTSIIAVLKIKNVVINLDSNGKLIYILPQSFNSDDFSKFKKTYEIEISSLKNSFETISKNKTSENTEILKPFKSQKTANNDFYCIFSVVSDKRYLQVTYIHCSKKYVSDYVLDINFI